MSDIVYTLGAGSFYNDNELRYSLRSIDEYLGNVGKVFIIGKQPRFTVKNIMVIPAEDSSGVPDTNIYRKLMIACEDNRITEDFLFVNDDHFLLDNFDANLFPYLYSCSLQQYITSKPKGGYYDRVKRVYSLYNDGKYFDCHYPILYNKTRFRQLNIDQAKGQVIKSTYCNQFNIVGEYAKDFKVTSVNQIQPIARCVSTYPRVNAAIWRFLQEKFPAPSKYEC